MSAARRYWPTSLLLSLALVSGGCGGSPPAPPAANTARGPSSDATFTAVDLQRQANVTLPELQGLPEGQHNLSGVDFQIGPGALQLGSRTYPHRPGQIVDIPVGQTFHAMHVLHSTQGGGFQQPGHPKHEQDGTTIGEYVVHYVDGSKASMPLVYGRNVRGWWNWDKMMPTPDAEVVWTGENPQAARYQVGIRLYMASWQNPYPDKAVQTLDFVSANAKAAPFCVAISLEGATPAKVNTPAEIASQPSAPTDPPIRSPPRTTPTVTPEMAEERRRQQEQFDAQRMRNEWAANVSQLKSKRASAFHSLTDELEKALIDAALKESGARNESARSRLADERNKFAQDRLRLPTSPEVRDAAMQYAQRRADEERRLLSELQALQVKTPAQADDDKRRVLAEEIRSAEKNVQQLTSGLAVLASMPRVSPSALTSTTPTPAAPALPPSPTTPTPRQPKQEPIQQPKVFLGPPPADWAVTADPPPERYAFPDELGYETLDEVRAGLVLFPPGQSPFLAAGKGGANVEGYTVYDLRSGKPIGEATGFNERAHPESLEGPALSTNGTYLAVPDSFNKRIMVGDVRQRKPVASLACDFDRPAAMFPSADRLLAINLGSTKGATLWELPSGKTLLSFMLADESAPEAGKALVSPGGRFLAHIARLGGSDSEVHFYDLSNGRPAGKLRFEQSNRNVEPRVTAIAFSADGSEFAAFGYGGIRTSPNLADLGEIMVCWDLATGRLVFQKPLERLQGQGMLTTTNRSEPLQWFPDSQGWLLFQKYVVDRRSAAIVQTLDTPGEANYTTFGTKVMDDRRVIVADIQNKFRVVEVQRTPANK